MTRSCSLWLIPRSPPLLALARGEQSRGHAASPPSVSKPTTPPPPGSQTSRRLGDAARSRKRTGPEQPHLGDAARKRRRCVWAQAYRLTSGSAGLAQYPHHTRHGGGEALLGQPEAGCGRDGGLGGGGLRLPETPDAVAGLPAAEARLLHSAHRGVDAAERCGEPLVDIHCAALDLRRDSPATLVVTSPHTGIEAVRRGIGLCDAVDIVGHGVHAHHRPEGLLAEATHLGGHAGQHGGLVERRTEIGSWTTS